MMWSVVIWLAAAVSVESYYVHDTHERLNHGRQLKIYLLKGAEKLEFIPANESGKQFLYWEKVRLRTTKGRVTGTGTDRRWYIDKVTFEDEGTYVQRDFWNKEISSVKVAVTLRHNYVKCVAGETLYVSLEGVDLPTATLQFSGDSGNYTLVRDGARVSQDIPDYWDRVQTHSTNIEIKRVNTTDEGRYILTDQKNRVVSITRMDLTDHHEYTSANPLLALLLLLGIPAGICCCCRKKIFKKQANTASAQLSQSTPETVHPPPSGPVGPAPPYKDGQPGYNVYDPNVAPAVYPPPGPAGPAPWNGPPASPGFNPAYPPQNVPYPAAGPAQPPQWNNPPPGQYGPAPVAPMGYATPPVMYSAPPPAASEPVKEDIKMQNMASSPADPLLSPPQDKGESSNPSAPSGGDNSYTFQIDGNKTTTNFL